MMLEDELSSLTRDLCIFPTRAFEFKNAGTVVIEQDISDVGSVVWDAEVVMAHYLDTAFGPRLLRGRRVVELGAGTGLAGIVAARLGASVLLTDQSKLLPTLINNARSNAAELELRRSPLTQSPPPVESCIPQSPSPSLDSKPLHPETHLPHPPPSRMETHLPELMPSSPTLEGGPSKNVSDFSTDPPSVIEDGELSPIAGSGCDTTEQNASSESNDYDTKGDNGDRREINDGAGGGGTWRVAELLLSSRVALDLEEKEKEVSRSVSESKGLFDLVLAADLVYLRDLWDDMAMTIKALLKPSGEAVMTFEQRRSNVDIFFGPPRFVGDITCDSLQSNDANSCHVRRWREVSLEGDLEVASKGIRLFRMVPSPP